MVATARRPETLQDLPVAQRVALDVTDDASVRRAREEVGPAHLSLRRHVFAVDDPLASRHPLHLASLDHAAFVAIVDRAVKDERHGLESRVRVRLTRRAVADVEMVIGQHDERIVEDEVLWRHKLRCEVSGANESRREWRNGDNTSDTTLEALVAAGRFRADLFYRLNVYRLALPALRERREDVWLLVNHFVRKFRVRFDKPILSIDRDSMERLLTYRWPGNIRELEHTIERAVLLAEGEVLTVELPAERPSAGGDAGGPMQSVITERKTEGESRVFLLPPERPPTGRTSRARFSTNSGLVSRRIA